MKIFRDLIKIIINLNSQVVNINFCNTSLLLFSFHVMINKYILYAGSKRFNNRKRPRCNGEFVEPVEEPMNGKLKRFGGITGN